MRFLPEIFAALSLCLAGAVLVHQQLYTNDVWFNLKQLRHHEPIAVFFVVAAISFVIGKYLGRFRLD